LIPFTKAHACGNDFLIVAEDAASKGAPAYSRADLTRHLCARNTGIGADGVEFFRWTGPKSGSIRLHNADGSIAEISGNGTRCVAAWMAESLGSQPGDTLEISTDAGLRICQIDAVTSEDEFTVEVTTGMGIPTYVPRTVLLRGGAQVAGIEVSTGNPHFVIVVDNGDFKVGKTAWQIIGKEICGLADFPNQTNVEFLRVVSPAEIEIRIFERGVGPTNSSGTGTAAAATAALALLGCRSPLRVLAQGGEQSVAWDGAGAELQLTGPAALIARGEAWDSGVWSGGADFA
jgi:diaminopimelate epimerase